MVDVSDSKLKQLTGKSWSSWNLPCCSTELDSAKIRESHRPIRRPDKTVGVNLLPFSLIQLYGTRPDVEYYSVSRCAGCRYVMKTQWLSRHYKRDMLNNLVCRRTESIVAGGKCLGKCTNILYDIRESNRDPFIDFEFTLSNTTMIKIPPSPAPKPPSPVVIATRISPIRSSKSSSSHSHKTESSSSKSKSSSSSSHKKSSSGHSSSKDRDREKDRDKHKSKSSSSSSYSSSSSRRDRDSSSKTHKSISSTASYVLSIPNSDDHGHQNDTVESILLSNSNSKTGMHIITMPGSSKNKHEPEYEQLKFYADSNDKRAKSAADSSNISTDFIKNSSKLFPLADGTTFKIPLKSKSSSTLASSGSSHSHSDSKKSSSKSSHGHHHSSSKSSSSSSSHDVKIAFKSSSSNSLSSSSTSSKTVTPVSLSSSDVKEVTKEKSHHHHHSSSSSTHPHTSTETKEKSHSKKKKKKKDKDEPRKVIPLKERAFHPDQHCGVVVSDAAQPCTRSLTCKTHSIALRRAVPGRSHPFDTLLAAHKKARDEEKNKGKEIATALTASTTSTEVETVVVKSKSKKSSHSSSAANNMETTSTNSTSESKPIHSSKSGSNSTENQQSIVITSALSLAPLSAPPTPGKSIVFNVSSSPAPKITTVQQQPPPVVQVSKPPVQSPAPKPAAATVKTQNRPVRVMESKQEPPGLSLFDIDREPENNFDHIIKIVPPSSSDLRRPRLHLTSALTEWNPLDRASKLKPLKRKQVTLKGGHPVIKFPPKRALIVMTDKGLGLAHLRAPKPGETAQQISITYPAERSGGPSSVVYKDVLYKENPYSYKLRSEMAKDNMRAKDVIQLRRLRTPIQLQQKLIPQPEVITIDDSDDDEEMPASVESLETLIPVSNWLTFPMEHASSDVSATVKKLLANAASGKPLDFPQNGEQYNSKHSETDLKAKQFLATIANAKQVRLPGETVEMLMLMPLNEVVKRALGAIQTYNIQI